MSTRATQFDFLLAGLRDKSTGEPLNGGTVMFYEVGTTDAKEVWTEEDKINAFTSYTLDSNGIAELFGEGNYKVSILNSDSVFQYTYDVVKTTSGEFFSQTVSSSSVSVTNQNDAINANTSANSITLNLATVTDFIRPLFIKKTSANNSLIIDPYSTELIDTDSTVTLTESGESIMLIPDASVGKWYRANHIAQNLVGLTATVDEINQVCDGAGSTAAEIDAAVAYHQALDATTDEVNTACDGIGVYLPRMKVVDVGVWNMVSTASVEVAHGLDIDQILGVTVLIRNDGDTVRQMVTGYDAGTDDGYISQISSTHITVARKTGGIFDSVGYDSAGSYNRGYAVIFYFN